MLLPREPLIYLRLTPHFSVEQVATHLSVNLEIQNPSACVGHALFLFNIFTNNVPAPPLRESDISARDELGLLPINFVDIPSSARNKQQHWCVGRATKGNIILTYDVHPRRVDIHTPVGTRIDLRRDQGGLQGVGKWFLPCLISDVVHTNIVQWILKPDVPKQTRCVWSFGEGPNRIIRVGGSDVTWNSVYMVGPVQSYPERGSAQSQAEAHCYWFGSLPVNLDRIKGYKTQLFPKMKAHFRSVDQSYSVFIRRAIIGYGGTGFLSSYVLEYDGSIADESDDSLVSLFTHEMVHSFSKLGPEEDDYDNSWFTEGIAELYSALLPYRFGLRGRDYYNKIINSHIQSYYTSPRINMDIRDAASQFFSDWYAVWIPYKRGCAYLIFIDFFLRRAVGNFDMMKNGPLDDIVIAMAQRTSKGEILRGKDWLDYLGKYFHSTDFPFKQHFHAMLSGKTLDFSRMSDGGFAYKFTRCDMRILDFGFDRNSLRTRVLTAVEKGSPAHMAGLTDGDILVEASGHNRCTEDIEATYRLTVERNGHVLKLEYLPRREQKTISWQLT